MYFLNTVIRFKMMNRRYNSVVCPVHRYIVHDIGAPEKIGKKRDNLVIIFYLVATKHIFDASLEPSWIAVLIRSYNICFLRDIRKTTLRSIPRIPILFGAFLIQRTTCIKSFYLEPS